MSATEVAEVFRDPPFLALLIGLLIAYAVRRIASAIDRMVEAYGDRTRALREFEQRRRLERDRDERTRGRT